MTEIVNGTMVWTGGSVNLTNVPEKTDYGVTIKEESGTFETEFRSTVEMRTLDDAIYAQILSAVGQPITLTLFGTVFNDVYLINRIEHTRLGEWNIIKMTFGKPTDGEDESLYTGLLSWDGGGEGKELSLDRLSENTDDGIDVLTNSTILLSGKKNIQGSDEYYFAPTLENRVEDDGTFWTTLLGRIGIDPLTSQPKMNTLTLFGVIWDNMVLTGRLSRRRDGKWQVITFTLEQQTA